MLENQGNAVKSSNECRKNAFYVKFVKKWHDNNQYRPKPFSVYRPTFRTNFFFLYRLRRVRFRNHYLEMYGTR